MTLVRQVSPLTSPVMLLGETGVGKGAFTGASARKRGRFERANHGTIFLDEIGELPLPAQVRLLRVLQNKELERVGGTRPVPLDVRVISATHRNLDFRQSEGSDPIQRPGI